MKYVVQDIKSLLFYNDGQGLAEGETGDSFATIEKALIFETLSEGEYLISSGLKFGYYTIIELYN